MRVFTNVVSLFLVAGCVNMAGAAEVMYDSIFRNARIIDGTGSPWYRGDVAVKGDKIVELGRLDAEATAPLVVDVQDHYLAPGFIDVHTHCEGGFERQAVGENFLRMGVTSVVMGNCGGSYLELADTFTSLSQLGLGPNVATLVGHNTVRRRVMGNEARDPSTTELLAMRELVRGAMEDGALGISTGLIYTPGTYSKTEEIVELTKEVAAFGGLYVSHMRSEGLNVTNAIEEALTIGEQAGAPVHISHFKLSSPKRHGQSTVTLGMVEAARAAGQDVTVDQYAYTASSTGMTSMLPDYAVAGTREEIVARLTNETSRTKIAEDMKRSYDTSGRSDLSHARIASFSSDSSLNGMSIPEIAVLWGKGETMEAQIDVVLDMMTSGGASMVFHSMDEVDVQNIMAYPNTMIASDSGIRTMGRGMPHPRGYGNNARVLGLYTRDLKLLRLEDAIRKMTSLPARTMRINDRGLLRPGMAADIVVFDLDKVKDVSEFRAPHAYAEGFSHVMVNGTMVINGGELTEERGGRILYGPSKSGAPVVALSGGAE